MVSRGYGRSKRREGRALPGATWLAFGLLLMSGVLGLSDALVVEAQEARAGGRKVLYVAEDSSPRSLNPLNITTMVERRTLELIHDAPFLVGDLAEPEASLVALGADKQPRVQASADRTLLTGFLKKAKFHNGAPVTVDDLRASFQAYEAAAGRSLAPQQYRELMLSTEADPIDLVRGFRIRFRRPQASPRDAMTLKLLPYRSFANPGTPASFIDDRGYSRRPIGAGPFKVVDRPEGSGNLGWTLEAFKDYHKGPPLLDGIRIVVHPAVQEQLNSLQAGQVHVIPSLNKEEQVRAKAYGGVILPYYIRNWWYLGYNCRKDALKSKVVRQALSKVIDRFELAQRLATRVQVAGAAGSAGSSNNGLPFSPGQSSEASLDLISGPFVPESPYYERSVPQPGVDRGAAALALCRVPGMSNRVCRTPAIAARGEIRTPWTWQGRPWTLRLVVRDDLAARDEIVALLRQQLGDFGITLRVEPALSVDGWERRVSENAKLGVLPYDLILGRWNIDQSDDIHTVFESGGAQNYYQYANPKLDRLFADFAREPDYGRRVTAMRQAHRLLADDMPALFLWRANQVAAFSPRVTGCKIHSFSFYVNPHRWDLKPEPAMREE